MRAFVTGATGFIGSHLVEVLMREGFEVVCLTRSTSSLRYIEGLNLKLVEGDCCCAESFDKVLSSCDYVFHIAGLTKAKSQADFYTANVVGTETLLRAVLRKAQRIKRFFFLSSLAATGPSLNGAPLSEDCEPMPVSFYGKTKYEAEKRVFSHKNDIPITIIRPPAVYGPKDKDMLILFKMIKSGIAPYWRKSSYSFIYVEDLVKGIIQSSLSKEAEGSIFFISDGLIYSSDDTIEAISNAINKKPLKISCPPFILPFVGAFSKMTKNVSIINYDKIKELRYKNWTCDSSKIQKKLNFVPKVTLKEGAKWTADWYRIHKWL
ncbi:MAG: NAD(P)-dependent oxidoreductase [Thermodesulfovibrionales bacterium]|nr:NAD(P)-dependent oxidoreductase [Thermodesulfovibrionales bacterium]